VSFFYQKKTEASAKHSEELANLRAETQKILEDLSNSHKMQVESLESSHEESKEQLSKSWEKQVAALKLELSATRDDLTKAKGAAVAAVAERNALQGQLESAQKAAELALTNAASAKDEVIEGLKRQLANSEQEAAGFQVRGSFLFFIYSILMSLPPISCALLTP
jgi:conserved oligomeric Golgi complex subunit 6